MQTLFNKFYVINAFFTRDFSNLPIKRFIFNATAVGLCALSSNLSYAQALNKTPFDVLEERIFEQPYTELPQLTVTSKNFGKKGDNPENQLFSAAKRTLQDERDWLPEATKPKLFNANGICFTGKWIIDTHSEYTGLFAQNTQANVIARASVALSGTKQKHKRSYGMAIKVFDSKNTKSANLFVMHSMAGTKTKNVLDLELDNHPKLGGLPSFSKIPTLLRISKDLKRADKLTGTNKPEVNYRPVNTFAEINNDSKAISPTWVKLVPKTSFRANMNDFREEMSVKNYPEQKIEYTLQVATGDKKQKAKATWITLGELILETSITSQACDINLHFTHPITIEQNKGPET